jgi:hypothetical protein
MRAPTFSVTNTQRLPTALNKIFPENGNVLTLIGTDIIELY